MVVGQLDVSVKFYHDHNEIIINNIHFLFSNTLLKAKIVKNYKSGIREDNFLIRRTLYVTS